MNQQLDSASFIFTLHLIEKWERHPAADLRGWKPLLQFTIFSSNKSVNYFYPKMKDALDSMENTYNVNAVIVNNVVGPPLSFQEKLY